MTSVFCCSSVSRHPECLAVELCKQHVVAGYERDIEVVTLDLHAAASAGVLAGR